MIQLLVLHGPNLNLLGIRQPEVYGTQTLEDINAGLVAWAQAHGVSLRIEQSNHEGRLIDLLHEAAGWADGVVLNPGGLSHTSVILADAVRASGVPTVEVHLTNIHARESYRRRSLVAEACTGVVMGLGAQGYVAACAALIELLKSGKAVASGPLRAGGVV